MHLSEVNRPPVGGRLRHPPRAAEAAPAAGLVASTVLYALPKTNVFDVRQMIFSMSTIVRILSRNFHSNTC